MRKSDPSALTNMCYKFFLMSMWVNETIFADEMRSNDTVENNSIFPKAIYIFE